MLRFGLSHSSARSVRPANPVRAARSVSPAALARVVRGSGMSHHFGESLLLVSVDLAGFRPESQHRDSYRVKFFSQ